MATSQRDPVRERQWRERVASWNSSGLTVREFCLRHGLTEASFYFWKRELPARDAGVTRPLSSSPSSSKPMFVPVTVLPATTVTVEVRCPSGHVVSLAGADLATLRDLFAAMAPLAGEASSC